MSKTISFRVDEEDYEMWSAEAKRENRSLSNWIVARMRSTFDENTARSVLTSGEEKARDSSTQALKEQDVGMEANSDVQRVGRGRVAMCEHGTPRGYHCWQCRGVAKVGGA